MGKGQEYFQDWGILFTGFDEIISTGEMRETPGSSEHEDRTIGYRGYRVYIDTDCNSGRNRELPHSEDAESQHRCAKEK